MENCSAKKKFCWYFDWPHLFGNYVFKGVKNLNHEPKLPQESNKKISEIIWAQKLKFCSYESISFQEAEQTERNVFSKNFILSVIKFSGGPET